MNYSELLEVVEKWAVDNAITLGRNSIENLAVRIDLLKETDVDTKTEDAPVCREAYYMVEVSEHDMEAMKDIRDYHRKAKPLHVIAYRVLSRLTKQSEPSEE